MASPLSHRLPSTASTVPVAKVMAHPVVTVDPDMQLLELTRLFVTASIGGAPVVDASGALIGVVSKTDLLRELYDQAGTSSGLDLEAEADAEEAGAATSRARDVMTERPVVVTENASLADAAGIMAREHLHRVFVVDGGGALTGVLSSSDIVHWLARDDEEGADSAER